jgi:pyridoxal phosphate enzyme (YggS family)
MVNYENQPCKIEKNNPEKKLAEERNDRFYHGQIKSKGKFNGYTRKFVFLFVQNTDVVGITQRISFLQQSIPEHVTIIAVSKTKTIPQMIEAYRAGLRNFGENKAQELIFKHPNMPEDTIWHFIGHLQTNKVKQIISMVHLIHSLDSIELLKEINKEAMKKNRVIDCLLQFHIATEDTKFGLNMEEAINLVDVYKKLNNPYIRITGVMGMASYTEDVNLIRSEFSELHSIFRTLKSDFFSQQTKFDTISMGMSGDYPIAIEEGSTMIRIGSSIFGDR